MNGKLSHCAFLVLMINNFFREKFSPSITTHDLNMVPDCVSMYALSLLYELNVSLFFSWKYSLVSQVASSILAVT